MPFPYSLLLKAMQLLCNFEMKCLRKARKINKRIMEATKS